MSEKERYATIGTWERVFREEGVSISHLTIRIRLKFAAVTGTTARNQRGQILRNGFYAESDVRQACLDLLKDLPQADAEGLLSHEGRRSGTIRSLARLLGVSDSTIASRLKSSSLRPLEGKDAVGRLCDFYAEDDVRTLCHDFLNLPQADAEGLLLYEGLRYGTVKSLARLLGISAPTIARRLKFSSLRPLEGKGPMGRLCDFYAEDDVRKLCHDLLKDLPQADAEGLLSHEGRRYGTINSLAPLLEVSDRTIASRLKSSSLRPLEGKDAVGRLCDFYAEDDVRTLCHDFLKDLPQADREGFFYHEGRRYGTINSLAPLLEVSDRTIASRLKSSSLRPLEGRSSGGRLCDFYAEDDVRTLCHDFLKDLPQADREGFFYHEGRRYGTIGSLSRLLGISAPTIASRLKSSSLRPLEGRSSGGRLFVFYAEDDARELCADLIAKNLRNND